MNDDLSQTECDARIKLMKSKSIPTKMTKPLQTWGLPWLPVLKIGKGVRPAGARRRQTPSSQRVLYFVPGVLSVPTSWDGYLSVFTVSVLIVLFVLLIFTLKFLATYPLHRVPVSSMQSSNLIGRLGRLGRQSHGIGCPTFLSNSRLHSSRLGKWYSHSRAPLGCRLRSMPGHNSRRDLPNWASLSV